MAVPCTGVTVSWDGTDFEEVREIRISGPGSLPVGRTSTFTLDRGVIEVACLGTTNISSANYGKRLVLQITGGGIAWNSDCIYQSYTVEGVVNDVTRYTVSFKVMDTVGAGSVPA
mgnify:CR=1 FL=1